jgi:hypothetical protein
MNVDGISLHAHHAVKIEAQFPDQPDGSPVSRVGYRE